MARLRLWMLPGCVALLAGVLPAVGGPPAGKGAKAPKLAAVAPARDAAAAMAGRIDERIAAAWRADKVTPAPVADDSEFVRRIYLDLAGRIPSVTEVRTFLDDKRADKRRRLIDKLLDGPRYVTHFTSVWRQLLLPEANTSFQTRFLVPGFETWIRERLAKNVPYDEMVRELITIPVANGRNNFFFDGTNRANPLAFYLAKELKPENLAAATARLFLGVKIECAQCHNHPFADWKREQFWGYAAFFAGIERNAQGDFIQPTREVADRRELTIPGTDRVVQASFIDGKEPKWKYKKGARQTLAEWMTRADNPYFARAAVNRMWGYFFGHGIIDPVDDMVGSEHSPSHPELLDELARDFAAHKFDLKYLMRTITLSKAYQRSSARTHKSQDDPRRFARSPLRGMTGEQLLDSIAQATGYQTGPRQDNPFIFGNQSVRAEFLTKFGNDGGKATEVQTSILQALSLMNGRIIGTATNLENSETLSAILDAPFLDTAGRIEVLYLATLSRKPTSKELSRLVKYVDAGGADAGVGAPTSVEKEQRSNKALADVFWALLNSGEFFLNH